MRPSATITPHSGSGGCTPKPRKLSEEISSTASPNCSGISAMIGPSAWGSTCRRRVLYQGRPFTVAAVTKSASRTRSTSARRILVKPAIEPTPTAIAISIVPKPSAVTISREISMPGTARNTSTKRETASSRRPRK